MKKVYAAAAQKKITDSLLSICERQVTQLENTIKLLDEKDIEQKAMYEGQLENLRQQIALYKDQITGYEKLIRIERRKKRLAIVGGIVTTGAALYLYLTK
jgi:CO dehydrogenase/acetyl-CoA synthase alpha subunit